jgi:hypothetical protein
VEILDKNSKLYKATNHAKQIPVLKHLFNKRFHRWIMKHADKKKVIDFTSTDFQNEVETTRDLIEPILSEWVLELSEITGESYRVWSSSQKNAHHTPIQTN